MVSHALSGCPQCQKDISEVVLPRVSQRPHSIAEESQATTPSKGYQSMYLLAAAAAREARQQFVRDCQAAEALLQELDRFAPERRQIVVCNSQRFRSMPLCRLLLQQSRAAWFTSPRRAQERAELAVAVAETLEGAGQDSAILADLRAQAWSFLANANRIHGDLIAAERCFRNAREHQEKGTEHPEGEARLLELEVSLLTTQRRFEEAEELTDRILRLYRRLGDRHQLGRAQLRKGICLGYREKISEAIKWLSLGLQTIDRQQEPGLELGARHNLAFFLLEDGQIDLAEEQLLALRPLYELRNEPLNGLRLQWLQGKIALARGQVDGALEHLQRAFDGFLEADTDFDAALVGLDLAEALFDLGRRREVLDLSLTLHTLFRSREGHQEALAALLLLHRTAQSEALTKDLLHRLAKFLGQAQKGAPVSYRDEFGQD